MNLVAVWLSLVVLGHPAHPACLEGHLTIQHEYRHSLAVFVGRVRGSRQDTATANWSEGTTYTVSVVRTFRGALSPTVELFSENSSGRFPMDSGATYLLFVYKNMGRLAVDNCGNSGLLSSSGDVRDVVERLASHHD
jgi:hypothetical protein